MLALARPSAYNRLQSVALAMAAAPAHPNCHGPLQFTIPRSRVDFEVACMPSAAAAFTLLAASGASVQPWPDAIDRVGILFYLAVAFGLPALGYVFMVIDFRRYLRSLRRALVVVASVASRATPYWAVRESHNQLPCFQALEVTFPCTEDEVLAAYRRRVKQLHPDHGGDLQQFLKLQKHFEQAMHLARAHAKVRTVSVE